MKASPYQLRPSSASRHSRSSTPKQSSRLSPYKLRELIGMHNTPQPVESEAESERSENGQPNGSATKARAVRRSLRLTVHSDDDDADGDSDSARQSDAADFGGSRSRMPDKGVDIFSLQRSSTSRHLQSHDQGPPDHVDSRRHSARLVKRRRYEPASRPFYLDELDGIDEEGDYADGDYNYEERSLTAYQRYNLRDRKRVPSPRSDKAFGYEGSRESRPPMRYNLRPHRGTRAPDSYQVPWSVAEQYVFAEKPSRPMHIPDKALMEATPELQPYERHTELMSGNHDESTSMMNDDEIIAQNIESTSSESPFLRIAGMAEYVKQLKEMVVFPLLYPSFFNRLGISPPRGVLFHGPPGTGKTLMARLLAESCSSSTRKVSFFMRNGSDCLSKWIGEAERNMKLLFQKAKECQPSIIFFDEIDGLAPERSARADQSHISLVSTLLALMDGLDDRGNVVVIGATNRIQALDPALRRPGRFDREFCFGLPDEATRSEILHIQTRCWDPRPEPEFLCTLARMSFGFSGADLRGLCTEAALHAIRRIVPEAYEVASVAAAETNFSERLIVVTEQDFQQAFRKMVPSTRRHDMTDQPAIPMPYSLLFTDTLDHMVVAIKSILGSRIPCDEPSLHGDSQWLLETNCVSFACRLPPSISQRLLKAACSQIQGFKQVAINTDKLGSDGSSAFAELLAGPFREAKLYAPSIVVVPDLTGHELADSITRAIARFVSSLTPSDTILVAGINLEAGVDVVDLPRPADGALRSFFEHVIVREVKAIVGQKLCDVETILRYGLEEGVDWRLQLLVSPFPDHDMFVSSISILPNHHQILALVQPLMALATDDFYRQFVPTSHDELLTDDGGGEGVGEGEGGDKRTGTGTDVLHYAHSQRLRIIRNVQMMNVPTAERIRAIFQMVFHGAK